MNIAQLQRLRSGAFDDGGGKLPQPRTDASGPDGLSFGQALSDAVDKVDGFQKEADGQIEAFVAGEQENVHEVMISMNQAQVSFQFMTEVRNKMLESYQELMRMQV